MIDGISVSYDYCKEDREDLKILRKYMRKAREENKEAKIKGFNLEIDGQLYSANELDTNSVTESSSNESEPEEVTQEEAVAVLDRQKSKKRKPKHTPTRGSGIGLRSKKAKNRNNH